MDAPIRLRLALAAVLLCVTAAWATPAAQRSVNLAIPGDVLPANGIADRVDARLEWQGAGWRVASIHRSDSHTHQPQAPYALQAAASVEFILSDIDFDNDFDVVVIDALSSTEKSVWRNDGFGNFRKLQTKRYGSQRFPRERFQRHAAPGSAGQWTAATGQRDDGILSCAVLSGHTLAGNGFVSPLTLSPSRHRRVALGGRSPPPARL